MLTFLGDVALLERIGRGSYKPDTPYIFNLEYVIKKGRALYPVPEKINLNSRDYNFERYFGSMPLAVNVANNHSLDYGMDGYKSSREAVEEIGISVIDANPLYRDGICFVAYSVYSHSVNGEDIFGFSKEKFLKAVQDARGNSCKKIIVFMHWGLEHYPNPIKSQTEIGRWLIDNGADIVVGAHPHCTQPIEEYKGKYIIYSLGNALFTNHSGGCYYDKDGIPWYRRSVRWTRASRKSFAVVYDEENGVIVRVDKLLQTKGGLKKTGSISVKKASKKASLAKLKFNIRKYGTFIKSNMFADGKLFNMGALKHELMLKKRKKK